MVYSFRDALRALDAGDAVLLRHVLGSKPGLASARASGDEGDPQHYAGFFQRATLLHHLAGNPARGPIPRNAAELATILLDAGALVDAPCGTLPGQKASDGATTLGLLMGSSLAAESGLAPGLIDVLLQRGAKRGFDDGQLLWTALYHCVECQALRELAVHLRSRGAPVDLTLASGLGELETAASFFAGPGELRPSAGMFAAARRKEGKLPLGREIACEALACAAANGRDGLVHWLLDAGTPIDEWVSFGPVIVTALHCAAWAGWPSTCELLLARGANPGLRDPKHDSSALGWAIQCNRQQAVEVFLRHSGMLDVWDALEHGFEDRALELLARLTPDTSMGTHPPGVFLRSAARLGREQVVRLLLTRGANPHLQDELGQTAAEVALMHGHLALADLLRQAQALSAGAPAPPK